MYWVSNCIFLIAMAYLFGWLGALVAGVYTLILSFIMFRYNHVSLQIVNEQRNEIERLRKK